MVEWWVVAGGSTKFNSEMHQDSPFPLPWETLLNQQIPNKRRKNKKKKNGENECQTKGSACPVTTRLLCRVDAVHLRTFHPPYKQGPPFLPLADTAADACHSCYLFSTHFDPR